MQDAQAASPGDRMVGAADRSFFVSRHEICRKQGQVDFRESNPGRGEPESGANRC